MTFTVTVDFVAAVPSDTDTSNTRFSEPDAIEGAVTVAVAVVALARVAAVPLNCVQV